MINCPNQCPSIIYIEIMLRAYFHIYFSAVSYEFSLWAIIIGTSEVYTNYEKNLKYIRGFMLVVQQVNNALTYVYLFSKTTIQVMVTLYSIIHIIHIFITCITFDIFAKFLQIILISHRCDEETIHLSNWDEELLKFSLLSVCETDELANF